MVRIFWADTNGAPAKSRGVRRDKSPAPLVAAQTPAAGGFR